MVRIYFSFFHDCGCEPYLFFWNCGFGFLLHSFDRLNDCLWIVVLLELVDEIGFCCGYNWFFVLRVKFVRFWLLLFGWGFRFENEFFKVFGGADLVFEVLAVREPSV